MRLLVRLLVLCVVTAGWVQAMPADNSNSSDLSPPTFRFGMKQFYGLSAGQSVSLMCKAKGNPVPSVTWLKDGAPIAEYSRRFDPIKIKRWKLVINNARPSDDGNYTCIVNNTEGTIKHDFVVSVVPRVVAHAPIIRDGDPGNHTVVIGTNVTLTCDIKIVDISSPPQITWLRHVPVNGSYHKEDEEELNVEMMQFCSYNSLCEILEGKAYPEDAKNLVLTNVNISDTGWYTCHVQNAQGQSHNSGYLQVLESLPDPEEASVSYSLVFPGIVALCFLVIVALVVCLTLCYLRTRREQKNAQLAMESCRTVAAWTKKVVIERSNTSDVTESLLPKVSIIKQRSQPFMDEDSGATFIMEYELDCDPEWEYPRSSLVLGAPLGEGAFGKVLRATTNGKTVAVKMLKEGHTDSDMKNLVLEMELMKRIGRHENIINLLGVSTQPQGHPLLVIVEFACHGSLKEFLHKHRPSGLVCEDTEGSGWQHYERPVESQKIQLRDLLSMANQVTKGMNFLSQRKCVHRDLAARNVLVCENNVIKIADFGLARDVNGSEYYRKTTSGRLPIRWMSPESVKYGLYTSQSDVWSFGILMHEMVTFGELPYADVTIECVQSHIETGKMMEKHQYCPSSLYKIMVKCWNLEPESRPSWQELVDSIGELLHQTESNTYLVLCPPIKFTPSAPSGSSGHGSSESLLSENAAVTYSLLQQWREEKNLPLMISEAMSSQATSSQAKSLQASQARSSEAMSSQAGSLHGTAAQAMPSLARSSEAMSSLVVSSEAMSSHQARSSEAMPMHGMTSQAVSLNGTTLQAMSPQGTPKSVAQKN